MIPNKYYFFTSPLPLPLFAKVATPLPCACKLPIDVNKSLPTMFRITNEHFHMLLREHPPCSALATTSLEDARAVISFGANLRT